MTDSRGNAGVGRRPARIVVGTALALAALWVLVRCVPLLDQDVRVDRALAAELDQKVRWLHEGVLASRSHDPGSVGQAALDAVGHDLTLRQVDTDGVTVASRELTAEYQESKLFVGPQIWWARVCVDVTLTRGTGDDRGEVVTSRRPCPPLPPGTQQPGELREPTARLRERRDDVPTPAPDRPVCFSGSGRCDE